MLKLACRGQFWLHNVDVPTVSLNNAYVSGSKEQRLKFGRYVRSKLANILFVRQLHTHFQATVYTYILVNCLNPGMWLRYTKITEC